MSLPTLLPFISIAFAVPAILLTPFSKTNAIPKWVFATGMLVLIIEQLLTGLTLLTHTPLEFAALQQKRLYVVSTVPGVWLLFALIYSRGNLADALRRKWIWIVPTFVIPISLALFVPEGLALIASDSSKPQDWVVTLGWSGYIIKIVTLIAMLGALVGIERTYRASVGTLRWKIKFMLYGLGTLFAVRFYICSQTILTQQIDRSLDTISAASLILASLLMIRSLLRSGSFDLGLYPSQSVISGSFTISLAGIYLIAVGLLSKLLSLIGGESSFVLNTFFILVSIVALGLIIQSDRFRQQTKRFVSRHFQRPIFDYRTVWLKVNEATSLSVERPKICRSSVKLLSSLFDVKLANIWLVEADSVRFALASSTNQYLETLPDNTAKEISDKEVAAQLSALTAPIDLETLKEPWSAIIKTANPVSFDKGGHRILVPLKGSNALVGFIVLGDRTNQLKFSEQEFDTLMCISNHLASSLLNADLTDKLTSAKEIEAFQTMATFFVHDLKNAVSTLNLMLKNMPKHWDNPEFREDALRGLGNTSSGISNLISKLGNIRNELKISPVPTEISKFLHKTIERWEAPDHVTFSSNLKEGLYSIIDTEKLHSVVTNLLINACESISTKGTIELETSSDNGYISIIVRDSGSGMSREFINDSLFKPFKTTKKHGLGIGMFQSKVVVEAHGGTISVTSAIDKGSTFTIKMPQSETPKQLS